MKSLVQNLILSLPMSEALENSQRNHHAVGLDYICLQRTPRLTVKLYLSGVINTPIEHNADGWVVAPHSHRYAFETHVLFGAATNILFDATIGGTGRHHFSYDADTKNFGRVQECGLRETQKMELRAGQSYFLQAREIHTIKVQTHWPVGLLLFQYADSERTSNTFFDTDTAPSLEGLYTPWSSTDLDASLKWVYERLR